MSKVDEFLKCFNENVNQSNFNALRVELADRVASITRISEYKKYILDEDIVEGALMLQEMEPCVSIFEQMDKFEEQNIVKQLKLYDINKKIDELDACYSAQKEFLMIENIEQNLPSAVNESFIAWKNECEIAKELNFSATLQEEISTIIGEVNSLLGISE